MSRYAHGDNIEQKLAHATKYQEAQARAFLAEIQTRYLAWKDANLAITTNDRAMVAERTRLLNEYKDFIDQQHFAETFDSRSNLHSTVLEEFLVYLFKDAIPHMDLEPQFGKGATFKSFFLAPKNFADLLDKPQIVVESKDHDFVIGTSIKARFANLRDEEITSVPLEIPAVAIECKTYLDKTMLEGASNSAEELKRVNPSARYFIVAEWLKLTEDINLRKYRIDQIYILRRQRNTDREFRFAPEYVKNAISSDLILDLSETVSSFLSEGRWDIEAAVTRGKLL